MPSLHSKVVRLAHQEPSLRKFLVPALRQAKEDAGPVSLKEFLRQEGDKEVRSPETGNRVKIKSLKGDRGSKLQLKLYKKWKKGRGKDEGEGSKPKGGDGDIDQLADPKKRKGLFKRMWGAMKKAPKKVAAEVKTLIIDEYKDWKALGQGVVKALRSKGELDEDTKTRIIHLSTKSTLFALGPTAALYAVAPPPAGIALKILVNAVVSPIMRKVFSRKMAKKKMGRWAAGLGSFVAGGLFVASEKKSEKDFEEAFAKLISETVEEALPEILQALEKMDVSQDQIDKAIAEATK